LRLAFKIYDVDKDGKISEKDLFNPFVCFSSNLYEDVFILDLPRIQKQLALKKKINKGTAVHVKKLSLQQADAENQPNDIDTLNLKEFMRIFESYCPAIIADIFKYIANINIPQPKIISDKILKTQQTQEELEDYKAEFSQDSEAKLIMQNYIENKALIEKITKVFKELAENPKKGEGKLYLTLYSLTNGFVYFKSLMKYRRKYLAMKINVYHISCLDIYSNIIKKLRIKQKFR